MSFVRYKIGNFEEIIEFDQYFSLYKQMFDYIVEKKKLKFEEGQVQNPTVTISILPPKDIEKWDQKHSYQTVKSIIVYSRKMGEGFQIYIHCLINIDFNNYVLLLVSLSFKMLILNILLKDKNLIYEHALLLSNGDVVCADCCGGKTTLSQRINGTNKNLKCIFDDGVLIDLKNRLVYPLGFIWLGCEDPFKDTIIDMSSPVKLNNVYVLEKGIEEKIKQIDKEQWLRNVYHNSIIFFYHPFRHRLLLDSLYYDKWVKFRNELQQKVEQNLKQKMKLLSDFKPLAMVTNTDDPSKKFEVLPDVV